MEIKDGQISIDIQGLIAAMTPEQCDEIAKDAVFSERLVECVCKWVATDAVVWDGDPGLGWSIISTGGNVMEKARRELLPLVPEAMQLLVRSLITERDQARIEARHYREAAWKLQRAWHAKTHEFDSTPRGEYMSQEQAKDYIERVCGEMPLPNSPSPVSV